MSKSGGDRAGSSSGSRAGNNDFTVPEADDINRKNANVQAPLILWGVELSPYTLKLQAAMRFKGIAFRRLPAQGNYFENAKIMLRLRKARQAQEISRYPQMHPALDEYPLVPLITEDKHHFEYDSSSIVQRFEDQGIGPSIVPEDPVLRFLCYFLNVAFDEFGLYLVHHMRWVTSAKSNKMGQRLAAEYKTALPPGGAWLLQTTFPVRQVKRLPYLFSVAPKNYRAPVRGQRKPKPYQDFPPTHDLIEQSWRSIVLALEEVLSQQEYILGNSFSLADASIYGQLGMNLVDPEAAQQLEKLAPRTYEWLQRIDQGSFTNSTPASYSAHGQLDSLLNILMGTFSALMVQNERAYEKEIGSGQTLFNEKAFQTNQALYSGKLHGHPFKSVVKTFQVRVWRDLKKQWAALTDEEKEELRSIMQLTELFEP
jgi:glutathione S-transferase